MFTDNGSYGFQITEVVKKIEDSYNALNRTLLSKVCNLFGIKRKFTDEQLCAIRHQIITLSNSVINQEPIKCNYEFYRELSPNLGYVNSYELNEIIHSLIHGELGKAIKVNKFIRTKGDKREYFAGCRLVNNNLLVSFVLIKQSSYITFHEDTNHIFRKYLSIRKEYGINTDILDNSSRIPTTFIDYLTILITEVILNDNVNLGSSSDWDKEFESYLRDSLILPLYQINFTGYHKYCRVKSVRVNSSLSTIVLIQDRDLKN